MLKNREDWGRMRKNGEECGRMRGREKLEKSFAFHMKCEEEMQGMELHGNCMYPSPRWI